MNRDANQESPNSSQPSRTGNTSKKKKSAPNNGSDNQVIRILVGIIAAIMLAAGALLFWFNPDADPLVLGLLIRVGSLLAVVCLAFPELMSLRGRMSAVLYGLALILVVVIAVRPKLSRVLVSLAIIGLGVGWVMRWITKVTKQ